MSQKYDSLGDKIVRGRQMNIGMSTEGNTGGISGLASKQLVLVGLGALSLSQSLVAGYGTLSFSVPVQSNQSLGLYASGNTTGESSSSTRDARSLTIVATGGVSVGLTNGSLLISAPAPGGTLTFYATSNTTGESSSSTRDVNSIVLRGAGIASVGMSNNDIIISVPAGGGVGDGGNIISAGTQEGTSLGTILFADSNGISFGMSGSTRVTASYTVPTQASLYAVGNTTQSSSGTVGFSNWSVLGAGNVSVGVSDGSLVISGAGGGGGGGVAISAGAESASDGTVVFSNSNGISFGMSDSTITASYTVPAQFTGGFSTQGNTAGDTGLVTGRMLLVGGNNVTLSGSTNGGSITITISGANQSNQTLGIYATSNTTGESSSSTVDARSVTFVGAGGASVGLSASRIVISCPTVPAQFSGGLSNIGNTAGDTGVVTGRLVLAGGNNITLSGSTNGGSITITVSAFNQSVQTLGLYALSNTTGESSSSTRNAQSISIVGQGGVSVGLSNGSFLISERPFSGGLSNIGNTSGDTGVQSARLVLAGGNNITLSGSTNAGSATVTISGINAFSGGLSNLGNTEGNTGLVTQRLVLVGGDNITLSGSTNGASATVSIIGAGGGGGGGYSAGVSNLGNTEGTTGTVSQRLVLVGTGGVTLSQSRDAGSATVTFSAPETPVIDIWQNFNGNAVANTAATPVTHGSVSNATLWIVPLNWFNVPFPGRMTVDRFGLLVSGTNTATSATGWSEAHTSSFSVGFYSLVNATQISLVTSGSRSLSLSANASNTASHNGIRWLTFDATDFNAAPSLTNAQYFLGIWMRTSGAALTASWGAVVNRVGQSAAMSGLAFENSNSNTAYPNPTPFHGYFSASVTTAMPDTIARTQLIQTGSGWAQMVPMVAMLASNRTGAYGLF